VQYKCFVAIACKWGFMVIFFLLSVFPFFASGFGCQCFWFVGIFSTLCDKTFKAEKLI